MKPRVLIAIPSYRWTTFAGLTVSLAAATAVLHRYPFELCGFEVAHDTQIDEARNGLLAKAFERRADWLISFDDDSSFAPQAPWELLFMAAEFGATVAGLPAPKKDGRINVEGADTDRGFARCKRIGGAVMAIDTAKVTELGVPRPWFVATPQPLGGVYSEDYYFCDQVVAAGGSVYADFTHPAGNDRRMR